MPKVLMLIAPEGFRDEELFHTKEELEKAGVEVEVASSSLKEARGMLGATYSPDKDYREVKEKDYDGIIFVGGIGSSCYFNDQQALKLAKDFFQAGKVVGAICIAPTILVNAGILQGKKATAFPSEKDRIASVGTYTGKQVEQDGKIITASGPEAARKFGLLLAQALKA